MRTDLTAKDLVQDPRFVSTVERYNRERNKDFSTSLEAVENFIEDYRYAHTNTFSAFRFADYLDRLPTKTSEQREYANDLSLAYEIVDRNVDEAFGESADFKDRANTFLDYTLATLTDPASIIAATVSAVTAGALAPAAGASVAAKSAASRSALRLALNRVMSNKVKKTFSSGAKKASDALSRRPSRVAITGAGAAGLEAPISALSNAQVQGIEQELGIRDIPDTPLNLDWSEVGKAAAMGAFGAGLTGGVLAIRDPYKKAKVLAEKAQKALENTEQGKAARDKNLGATLNRITRGMADVAVEEDKTPKKTKGKGKGKVQPEKDVTIEPGMLEGLYVKPTNINKLRKISPELAEEYDTVGFVSSFDGNKITVDFLAKDPKKAEIASKKSVKLNLSDVRALSQEKTDEAVDFYITNYGKFFDRDEIAKGEKFLQEEAERLNITVPRVMEVLLDKNILSATYGAINDILTARPELARKIDKRSRLTEIGATILENVDEADIPELLADALTENNIDFSDFVRIIRADASISGTKLVQAQKISPALYNKLSTPDSLLGIDAKQVESAANFRQREVLKRLREEREREISAGKFLSLGIDLWRSLLVIQPATTLRNIAGSVIRTPEAIYEAFTDNAFSNVERKILGIAEEDVPKDFSRRGEFQLFKELITPGDAIDIVDFMAEVNPRVKKELIDVFDDRLGKVPEGGFFNFAFKMSNRLNIMNRMQDRAFKSAAFAVELDRLIKRKRNLGEFADVEKTLNKGVPKKNAIKLDNFESLVENGKLDFIDDEMISRSISKAYQLTYQNRNAGDELLFGGGIVNDTQRFLNNFPLVKAAFPFPNFWINSLVYMFNRPLGGTAKLGAGLYRATKNFRQKNYDDAAQKRTRQQDIDKKISEIKRVPVRARKEKGLDDELKQLLDESASITKYFDRQQKDLKNLKEGISESIQGGALIGTALAIRNSDFAGPTADSIRDSEGRDTNLTPAFPIYPYLVVGDIITRVFIKGQEFDPEQLARELGTALGGPSVRGGALGSILKTGADYFYQALDPDDPGLELETKLGEALGGTLGYFLGVVGTPLRVVEDVVKSFRGKEFKDYMDRRQQKDFLGEKFAFNQPGISAAIDGVVKSIIQGTPFESGTLEDIPGVGTVLPKVVDAPERFVGTKEEPLAAPPDTAQKQYLGFAIKPKAGLMQDELQKNGVSLRIAEFYTGLPEYNNVARSLLGKLADDIVEDFVQSPEYANSSSSDKKDLLTKLYRAKSVDEMTAYLQKSYRNFLKVKGLPSNAKNLRQAVTGFIKQNLPILNDLKNIRKKGKSNISKALERVRNYPEYRGVDISLKYINEKDPNNADKIRLLTEVLAKVSREIAQEERRQTPITARTVERALPQLRPGFLDPRSLPK